MGNKLFLPCEAADLMIGDKPNILVLPRPVGEASDGDHSFDDLYKHRSLLFLGVLSLVNNGWYSEKHSDGTDYDGWFIAGVELNEGEQITYHLPNEYLELAATNLQHREYAPAWDGHTADDVIDRLTYWIGNGCQLLPEA
jgi:hypothetical protein